MVSFWGLNADWCDVHDGPAADRHLADLVLLRSGLLGGAAGAEFYELRPDSIPGFWRVGARHNHHRARRLPALILPADHVPAIAKVGEKGPVPGER